MTDLAQHVTWRGRPVHELTRDELHAAFATVMIERDAWMAKALKSSSDHIRDLAAFAAERRPTCDVLTCSMRLLNPSSA